VLTPQEASDLARRLRQMAADGHAIVYISHKLKEVMDLADRITVLRGGRNVATVRKDQTDECDLTRLMIGRELPPQVRAVPSEADREVMLEAIDLNITGDRGVPALRAFSLKVLAGQIYGLAGVSGNGQRELAEALTGSRRIDSGTVILGGANITNLSPERIIRAGLSLIPEDRTGTGLVPTLSTCQNAILKSYRRRPISRGLALDWREIVRFSRRLVQDFSIRVGRLEDPVRKLSGGNQQRLLLAREIYSDPRVMIAVHPTRGLDVQATAEIHQLLLRQRDSGVAILLISEDLDEILALSDRLGVIFEGRMMGEMATREARVEQIGLMMTGATRMEDAQWLCA
jgi:simple sugar transport system ATP-binding protein